MIFLHNDTQHNDVQHNDIQHNDIQHNDTQHIGLVYDTQHKWTLTTTMLCIMLSVIMLNVIMLSVVAPLRSAKNAKRTRKPQQTLVLCRTGLVFSEKINFD
jgi:hypothetical protein